MTWIMRSRLLYKKQMKTINYKALFPIDLVLKVKIERKNKSMRLWNSIKKTWKEKYEA